jgi:RNA polymerase sigma-70 factor (ECF subfamily)
MMLSIGSATETLPDPTSDESDADLIARLCDNDLSALGSLFDRYYPQIYRTAYAILRDSAVAEDIAQDCFLKLHQYARRIDTTLPLAPWLYRVTVNLSYTWISRRRKRRVSLEALVDQLMSPAVSAPDHLAEKGETERRVRAAVAELPFNQRVVVALYYLSGQSLEEIADILACPVGTIKSRLYYARETLRRRLGDWQQTFEVAHGYAGIG